MEATETTTNELILRMEEKYSKMSKGQRRLADYVRENGLQIYGFACVADKETLLELNAEDEVFGIRTEEAG